MKTIKEALEDFDEEFRANPVSADNPDHWAYSGSNQRLRPSGMGAQEIDDRDEFEVVKDEDNEFDLSEPDEEEDGWPNEIPVDDMSPDACEECGGNIVGGECTSCGKATSKYDINEDGPVGYEGHEVEKEVIEEADDFGTTANRTETELPADYETCGDCGFDHGYEYEEAAKWHTENPGSYDGLQETFSFDRFMDNILLTETRTIQYQPDSPQRERQARRQERPLGRTRYVR
jgi:hypothetical protein